MASSADDWAEGNGRLICVDFDGVIHSYQHGFEGIDQANDPPVPGAFEFLDTLLQAGFRVAIYSSRSREYAGLRCMANYLHTHGAGHLVHKVSWPREKPAAWLTIDDRAVTFDGTFPSLRTIDRFRPWNRAHKKSSPLDD